MEAGTQVLSASLKREIRNIIKSYTGWYDPFSELIQNALDAVDARKQREKTYDPKIWIEINVKENYVCVTDNGIGLSADEFATFLQPNVSFKGHGTRGDKGVGATYLAYGFNFLQIGTKAPKFTYVGDLKDGRKWLEDEKDIVPRPTVRRSEPTHKVFSEIDRGSTFCLRLVGDNIRPNNLGWIEADRFDQWQTILRLKTPLGGIYIDRQKPTTKCYLRVIGRDGKVEDGIIDNCEYLYPHTVIATCVDLREMVRKRRELIDKGKSASRLSDNYYELSGIYCYWNYKDVNSPDSMIGLEDHERALVENFKISMYGFFTYTLDVWDEFNDEVLRLRKRMRILRGGLQLAANGMPQGELILIPLTRNIGYQHNTHVVLHFASADADLGRKGFQPELEDLAQRLAVSVVELFLDWREHLKQPTGAPPRIIQDKQIHDWKTETEKHERDQPLAISRKDVFLPTNEIALTAAPRVEQDAVALFNQLLAGGVIRGIKLMAASQYKKYDGLWRGRMKKPFEHYLYNKENNPLGVVQAAPQEFESSPYVLEYKYTFDALLEEIEREDKDESSIDLVVCWEMGDRWKTRYRVTPLLHFSNLHHRQIHGVTHLIRDAATGQHVFMAVVLKELIDYINNPDAVQEYQKKKYMEERPTAG
jgi:hypothetical protein